MRIALFPDVALTPFYALIAVAQMHSAANTTKPRNVTDCPRNCTCTGTIAVSCSHACSLSAIYKNLEENYNTTLNTLSLNNCVITELSEIPFLEKLVKMDLSCNKIALINSPHKLKFPNVKQLNLSHNLFKKLERDTFIMFPAVEELDLAFNTIEEIDWEAFRLFKLRRLVIANNKLTSISEHLLRYTPSLEYLDLSYNNLVAVQSSNFFSAQKLKEINLSNNRIRLFNYDSFSPLYQLKNLDLSNNELDFLPGSDLRQLVGLHVLKIGGNKFKRVAEAEFVHPTLQDLILSNSSELHVIEQYAFTQIPYLHSVDLSYATSLTYISPRAFVNNTMLNSINLSHGALEVVPAEILSHASTAIVEANPLYCACIPETVGRHISRIPSLGKATCLTQNGTTKQLSNYAAWPKEECYSGPLLPFGEVVSATVGERYTIYCASRLSSDHILWKLPNSSSILASDSLLSSSSESLTNKMIFADTSHHSHLRYYPSSVPMRPRVVISNELIRIDVVLSQDHGVYKCSVKRDGRMMHGTIKLNVQKPRINLYSIETGPHYTTLAWNGSLNIAAKKSVRFFLTVRDANGILSRTVQLSLHNPWHSYNIMRLKSNQNYTFCLCYKLREDEVMIYETCLQQHTLPNLSFFESISTNTFLTFISLISIPLLIFIIKVIYARFHIWQQEKHRSRMNQSISGQSFLSSSSNGVDPSSITYENHMQMHQTNSLQDSQNNQRKNSRTTNEKMKCSSREPYPDDFAL